LLLLLVLLGVLLVGAAMRKRRKNQARSLRCKGFRGVSVGVGC
jgi:hypothetical protein